MNTANNPVSRGLLIAGVLLLLLGLLTGLGVGAMENPRMGLSSHLQGITNGLLLIGLGLMWPYLNLNALAQKALFWRHLKPFAVIARHAAIALLM